MKIRVFSGNCLFSASEFEYLSNAQNLSNCDNGERAENLKKKLLQENSAE